MTVVVGPLVTDILKDIRDEAGSGTSRTFVRTILSHAQRLTNFIIEDVIGTATLTLQRRKLAYTASQLISDYLKPLNVTYNGNDLARGTLESLAVLDSNWPRSVKSAPTVFVPIGLDILIIYPGLETEQSVTVKYVADTQDIAGDNSTMSVSDHAVPMVKDLATALLLLRQRDFDVLNPLFSRLTQRFGNYQNE